MHKSGHEHHVVLPHEALHAAYTLKQSRHVIPQHLQSCTLVEAPLVLWEPIIAWQSSLSIKTDRQKEWFQSVNHFYHATQLHAMSRQLSARSSLGRKQGQCLGGDCRKVEVLLQSRAVDGSAAGRHANPVTYRPDVRKRALCWAEEAPLHPAERQKVRQHGVAVSCDGSQARSALRVCSERPMR